MEKKEAEIIIIGAAIIDILVRPADEEVFRTGSYPAEDIRMSTGADALNESTILSRMGKRVLLETVIGSRRDSIFSDTVRKRAFGSPPTVCAMIWRRASTSYSYSQTGNGVSLRTKEGV